ncbi:MAG: (E)-4-hydroxy-3-methylbut-2-enyl-diphosphate synthase [Melioribacteraceae bacterium]|nr:(E)-4-hydroxy-3-methylbut-2-enyl-diphosphate synthase [Melioribacteraceae bacterium]MCF8354881.1 (E)-4-hydroxy-3-methylbut-2-enyl-diphosphate synthase [Melioribacteraceae bacterium]MCF8393897.1 (E)-4-hydroxy-3-methylbut-2-enyl-diphosphate synthase [Melioribacteraceae bacterium]MCF8419669.1 (E)-4-hydroxy-3-methylbut-2-enyl-diphosphate synthase [Melioribacteraceae bacterium]
MKYQDINSYKKYCSSLTKYSRYKTREVKIGNIPMGGNNPIRIQSMTTTDTMNTMATVEQTISMVEAGCEYVRITAPSKKDAENLANIKKELKIRGYNVPLVADIHFTPNAAEIAARIVEKVRVNPGNYADKKKFETIEYTDNTYEAELERIREKFSPLVKICKEYGTAMRIGTNHGSLSDRIMSRFGDTPLGMVESALEFVRICEDLNYHEIVLSMKASNTQVMIQAYRLLIQKMEEEAMNYPIHLGVTEAGDGEDGRIKSAVGIGTLLEDGIGDTIRVSLTEPPENEAPVAIDLADRYEKRAGHKPIIPVEGIPKNPYEYEKYSTFEINGIGDANVPVVVADYSKNKINDYSDLKPGGYNYSPELDKWNLTESACDILYLGKYILPFEPPQNIKVIYDFDAWKDVKPGTDTYPLFTYKEYLNAPVKSERLNFVRINIDDVFYDEFRKEKIDKTIVFILTTNNNHGMPEQRRVFFRFMEMGIRNPVIIKRDYTGLTEDRFMLYSSTDLGGLFIDGFGDGVWVTNVSEKDFIENQTLINRTLFGILQAARVRISKTEYIACPSCGRTLFDLVEVTDKIRKRTQHLKGVKIGIMGCIVNGPGEMADADYGYVGSGVGKITLYRGKDVVMRSVDSKYAVDELINLIKEDNNWAEPK